MPRELVYVVQGQELDQVSKSSQAKPSIADSTELGTVETHLSLPTYPPTEDR